MKLIIRDRPEKPSMIEVRKYIENRLAQIPSDPKLRLWGRLTTFEVCDLTFISKTDLKEKREDYQMSFMLHNRRILYEVHDVALWMQDNIPNNYLKQLMQRQSRSYTSIPTSNTQVLW